MVFVIRVHTPHPDPPQSAFASLTRGEGEEGPAGSILAFLSYVGDRRKQLTLRLVWSNPLIQIASVLFILIIGFGGTVGFVMGWGFLSRKTGCALLLAVPILTIVVIVLEPIITGERPSSTAGVAIPIAGFLAGTAAATGAIAGKAARWLNSRR